MVSFRSSMKTNWPEGLVISPSFLYHQNWARMLGPEDQLTSPFMLPFIEMLRVRG